MNDTAARTLAALSAALLLAACNAIQYQPLDTIDHTDTAQGYRLDNAMEAKAQDENFVVMAFSGGGTRAAALGYGVLEELSRHPLPMDGTVTTLTDSTDIVYGVSGGSVLAAYYSLHGKDTIPSFEKNFLKQNFQKLVIRQTLSLANMPRMLSPEFGRGDMLQEQFENTLFGKTSFADLAYRRKGPFAVISATDMSLGRRVDFTQEFFDNLCLDLSQLRVARAVAASSAVPLVFSPVTLNNHGGRCGYAMPEKLQLSETDSEAGAMQRTTRQEFLNQFQSYADSGKRPYIHLLDGGLTDNLGLRNLLEAQEIYPKSAMRNRLLHSQNRRIIVISVNAANQISSNIDQSAVVPGIGDQISAVIDVPIEQNSQETLRRFRSMVDYWNEQAEKGGRRRTQIYFISLNLRDLPESELRTRVLNIPTTYYLMPSAINDLKTAAAILVRNSEEFKRLAADLKAAAQPAENTVRDGPSEHAEPPAGNTAASAPQAGQGGAE